MISVGTDPSRSGVCGPSTGTTRPASKPGSTRRIVESNPALTENEEKNCKAFIRLFTFVLNYVQAIGFLKKTEENFFSEHLMCVYKTSLLSEKKKYD